MNTPLITSGALLALTTLLPSQRVTYGPVDVEAISGQAANLGVQHDPVTGNILISHRSRDGSGNPPHGVTVIDPAGNLVASWDQTPLTPVSTVWGLRDMCDDGAGNFAGGYEGGVVFFDLNGNAVTTFAGQTVAPFVSAGPIGTGTHRALAFDPAGNGGAGSIFLGDFGADIDEVALDGTLLQTYPNPASDEWSAYGLAFMPASVAGNAEGSIWVNSAPNVGDLKEYAIDRTAGTLTATGRAYPRATNGSQGGIDYVEPSVDGRGGVACDTWELLALDQSTPDVIYAIGPDWPGYFARDLLAGTSGGPLANEDFQVNPAGDTSWEYDIDAPAGTNYVLILNFGPLTPRAPGPIGGFNAPWFLELLTTFTTPSGASVDEFGVAGSPISFPVNAAVAAAAPIDVHAQALIVDPSVPVGQCGLFLGLGVSDRLTANVDFPPRFEIRAAGSNSFNSDTASGFFSVTSNTTDPNDAIAELTFDWVASSNPAQSDMKFDTDQTGMADEFWNGNATGTGACMGTYRNGSDLATGLDYANAQNNLSNSGCAQAGENAGVEATNQVGTTPDYRTLTWRFVGSQFSGGAKLEFDIDTDLGAGVTGADMAGMVVTIRTVGGTVLTGELAVDPAVADASQLIFP